MTQPVDLLSKAGERLAAAFNEAGRILDDLTVVNRKVEEWRETLVSTDELEVQTIIETASRLQRRLRAVREEIEILESKQRETMDSVHGLVHLTVNGATLFNSRVTRALLISQDAPGLFAYMTGSESDARVIAISQLTNTEVVEWITMLQESLEQRGNVE